MDLARTFGLALVAFVSIATVACAAPTEEDAEEATSSAQAQTTGPAFYADGTLYRTVGTPTDLSTTGAPAKSFDIIWAFRGAQAYNVSTVAPGDRDYNGGRWMVHGVSFPHGYAAALVAHDANGSGDFDSDEEVAAAMQAGDIVDAGVLRAFVCPVIKLPASQR